MLVCRGSGRIGSRAGEERGQGDGGAGGDETGALSGEHDGRRSQLTTYRWEGGCRGKLMVKLVPHGWGMFMTLPAAENNRSVPRQGAHVTVAFQSSVYT